MHKNESHITKFVNEPVALYDIGVGPKTEWLVLKRHWPNLKLFGCEPMLVSWSRLKSLWDKLEGKLWHEAIGDGTVQRLNYLPKHLMAASLINVPGRFSHWVEVSTITLDQFDERAGFQEDVILWMDIEGYELQALRTGTKLLASGRVKVINLEERLLPGGHGWTDRYELRDFLNSFGYRRASEYNRHVRHQDVIYVKC